MRDFFSGKKFSQRVPLQFFLLFCDIIDVEKSQRVPPFSFFRHCEIFSENKNFSPSNFLMFCDRMDVEKPQRAPLSVFRHCETFFLKFFSLARHSVHFFGFSIFEYCKLTLGSPFAIFELWIWRRLGPVPAFWSKLLLCFFFLILIAQF